MLGGIPLRAVLELGPLATAKVVAGAGGLDRPVRHVNVMEVPDIIRWVKADELLLTTTYPLRDDRAGLVELVPRLAEKGLAGLAIKPARYIDSIPAPMIEAAERLSFPLIELPPDSSFNEIINAVLTVILNAQALRLQRSAEIHERFTSIVLSGGGLRQIADVLAESITRPVAIVDATGTVLTASHGADALVGPGQTLWLPSLASPSTGHPIARMVEFPGGRRVTVQPIQVGTELFGAVVAVGSPEELAEEQRDALEYAATIAALRQVQARAVAEADRRFQAVCLEELVTGHVTDRAVLMERAVAFAWDLSVPRAALVAQFDEVAGRPFAQLAGSSEEAVARHRLAEGARAALGRGAIIWERSAEIAALVAPGPRADAALRDAGEHLRAEARRLVPQGTVSIGIGRIRNDPLRLAESFAEARRALSIGRWARGTGSVCRFDDLGVDRLLVGTSEAELADFVVTTIGPLVAFDREHGTALVETLDVYLATRNAALAARQLFVHYNTLKNRLHKIEELVGPILDDPDRCLGLALALRIRRLPSA